jgi:hypothetical protein
LRGGDRRARRCDETGTPPDLVGRGDILQTWLEDLPRTGTPRLAFGYPAFAARM